MINRVQTGRTRALYLSTVIGLGLFFVAGRYLAQGRDDEGGESETRVNVRRVNQDTRVLATAIESYFTDHNEYPAYTVNPSLGIDASKIEANPEANWTPPSFMLPTMHAGEQFPTPYSLTTPISYISGLLADPFSSPPGRSYAYYVSKARPTAEYPRGKRECWIVWSAGPDGDYDLDWTKFNPSLKQPHESVIDACYDPSNGTISNGDVFRWRALGSETEARECRENLHKLDDAKVQWALEAVKKVGDTPTEKDLIGPETYLKIAPRCPSGGSYTLGAVGQAPVCDSGLPGHEI